MVHQFILIYKLTCFNYSISTENLTDIDDEIACVTPEGAQITKLHITNLPKRVGIFKL